MSTVVFGKNIIRVGQWLLPQYIGDKGLLEKFSFKVNQAKIVLEESNEFIGICAPNLERNKLWNYLIGKHKEG